MPNPRAEFEARLDEFERKVEIDKNLIDDEFNRQLHYFQEAADLQADLSFARDTVENQLKTCRAQKWLDLKTSDQKYTEKQIDALVEVDEDVIRFKSELAALESLSLRSVSNARRFEQRGWMVKALGELAVSGYYTPTGVKTKEYTALTKEVRDAARSNTSTGTSNARPKPARA
jgi:hypothetical protein